MSEIYQYPIENPPPGIYSIIKEFAVAEVDFNWMSNAQNAFPHEWDILHQNRESAADAAIHLWMRKYMPEMYNWLCERNVDWIGFTSADYFGNDLNEVLYIRMHRDEDVIAFRLTWC